MPGRLRRSIDRCGRHEQQVADARIAAAVASAGTIFAISVGRPSAPTPSSEVSGREQRIEEGQGAWPRDLMRRRACARRKADIAAIQRYMRRSQPG